MKKLTLTKLTLSSMLVAPIVALPLLSVSLATNDQVNSTQTTENDQFKQFVNFKSDKLPYAWPVEYTSDSSLENRVLDHSPTYVYSLNKWRETRFAAHTEYSYRSTISTSLPR